MSGTGVARGEQSTVAATKPFRWPWSTRLVVVASTLLTAVYRLVGDCTAWAECITVWPPILWWLLLLPLSLHSLLVARRRAFAAALAFALLFVGATMEWSSLIRGDDPALRARFEEASARPPVRGEPSALRIVTWNVAGQLRLDALERYRPDVCFIQETGWSPPPAGLTGAWSGFHWSMGVDAGVLSRYPVKPLPSRRVGP